MNIAKATILYFTGRGTTKQYAEVFAQSLPYENNLQEIRHDNSLALDLGEQDLLVLAGPVYAGFMSPFIWKQLENVTGHNTPTVLIAVYGARDYDNALLEMDHALAEKGFTTVGGAAVVARHSIAPTIAENRPSKNDLSEIEQFAQTIADRLSVTTSINEVESFKFKGALQNNYQGGPIPHANEECVECGICAKECPAAAIPQDNPKTSRDDLCISCMRCVGMCPHDARSLPEEVIALATEKLQRIADSNKPNEFF